jgi:hypothetical protein
MPTPIKANDQVLYRAGMAKNSLIAIISNLYVLCSCQLFFC